LDRKTIRSDELPFDKPAGAHLLAAAKREFSHHYAPRKRIDGSSFHLIIESDELTVTQKG